MTLKEVIEINSQVVITEGIKYFKFSKRIDKVIYKVAKSKNQVVREKLIKALSIAKDDFKKAEDEYELGNEENGKKLYKEAQIKNKVMLKKVMNTEMKSFIIKTGIFGGIAGLLYVVSNAAYNLDPQKVNEALFKIDSATKDISNEINYLGKDKDAAYFDAKYTEVGRRAGHVTKQHLDRITQEFKDAAPQAAEDFKKTGKKLLDTANETSKSVNTKTFSGYVSGLTDEERGIRSR